MYTCVLQKRKNVCVYIYIYTFAVSLVVAPETASPSEVVGAATSLLGIMEERARMKASRGLACHRRRQGRDEVYNSRSIKALWVSNLGSFEGQVFGFI